MNATYPKCNKCNAINTAAAPGWVRLAAVNLQGQPIGLVHVTVSGAPAAPGQMTLNAGVVDFCAACAPTVTMASLPQFVTVKKP